MVLPIDIKSPVQRMAFEGSLAADDFRHAHGMLFANEFLFQFLEYEILPNFKSELRFQSAKQLPFSDYRNCDRTVLSTLVPLKDSPQAKVVSFLVDTGSPWTFLSAQSLEELGYLPTYEVKHFVVCLLKFLFSRLLLG
jgi:hypothetical protein